jgi:two-component system cell cycle sensor histidine kinase/response regulator CckA
MIRSDLTNAPIPGPTEGWALVIDDQDAFRKLIISALSSEKLEILEACDSSAALRVLEGRATEPVLILLDVLMPGGLDGLALARVLKKRQRRSKIVLTSGHLTDAAWWPTDLRDVVFLGKPFSIARLVELLDAAQSEFHEPL